jgi:hypothetical protein
VRSQKKFFYWPPTEQLYGPPYIVPFHNNSFHNISSPAYLLSEHTCFVGSEFHTDPQTTDAYNGLISGQKWWTYLPKDLYEYRQDYTCDTSCSDPPINFQKTHGAWLMHILPQLRY